MPFSPAGRLRPKNDRSARTAHLSPFVTTPDDALRWIVHLLREMDIPFQAAGGLAARAYGASRPLVDLDFYVPGRAMPRVRERAHAHVSKPPLHVVTEHWDITFMQLVYANQRIELGDADEAYIYDKHKGTWTQQHIDFTASVPRTVLGVHIPVMPKKQLIAYKRGLDRPVDRQDLREMQA